MLTAGTTLATAHWQPATEKDYLRNLGAPFPVRTIRKAETPPHVEGPQRTLAPAVAGGDCRAAELPGLFAARGALLLLSADALFGVSLRPPPCHPDRSRQRCPGRSAHRDEPGAVQPPGRRGRRKPMVRSRRLGRHPDRQRLCHGHAL